MAFNEDAALRTRCLSGHRLAMLRAQDADELARGRRECEAQRLYLHAARLEEMALHAVEELEGRGHDYGPAGVFLARSAAWLYRCARDEGYARMRAEYAQAFSADQQRGL